MRYSVRSGGRLNANDPRRLVCLNVSFPVVLEGLGGEALEEVWSWRRCDLLREGRVDLEVSKDPCQVESVCLLLEDQMPALSYCTSTMSSCHVDPGVINL